MGTVGIMLTWLYRLLFARRVVWILEHPDGLRSGWVRLIVYDPDDEDFREAEAKLWPYREAGWRVRAWPKESDRNRPPRSVS